MSAGNTNTFEELKHSSDAVVSYVTRPVNADRLAAALEFAGPSVLDVGCGNGAYVLQLQDRFDIRGVDYKSFDSWQALPDRFGISDAATLALPDESVDTILSFETLEHLQDPRAAVIEYFRVVRKNLIVTVPNCTMPEGLKKSGLIYSHWSDPTHLHFFDMQSIISLLQSAGFRVVLQRYINKVHLGVAVMDSLGVSGLPARIGARLFMMLQRRQYYLTTLLVAEKPNLHLTSNK